MTLEDVKARLKKIEVDQAGDDERQHGLEDQLWEDALRAIAKGECDDPQALAKAVLKSKKLDFSRWYA